MLKAERSLLHYEVPVLDLSVPMTHLVLNASALLAESLENAGLLAAAPARWALDSKKGCLVVDIKTLPAEPADPIPITPLTEVECQRCGNRFIVI